MCIYLLYDARVGFHQTVNVFLKTFGSSSNLEHEIHFHICICKLLYLYIFYTFLFKSLDIYFYKKYCHSIYSLCYLSEVTQYLVPRRIGLILLILVQYCAVLEGAFQGRCASQISASHIYVADVLRSLWFHVIRLFSTRCQMRRYVKKFNLVYPFYSWCTLNLKFFLA